MLLEEQSLNKVFNRGNFGFSGLQWLFWSGYCTVIPFLVVYLKTKGYDEVQTGAIMAAISLTSIFSQPFWGHFCDRRNTIRNVLVGCLLASGVVTLFIPVFYRSFIIVILICLVISFTENSMSSIIDSWTMNIAVHKPWIDYGLTRGMGSLGYALTAVIFGALLDRFGYDLMFYTHFVIILFFVGFCFYVDRTNRSVSVPASCEAGKEPVPKLTLKGSSRFIWFLVSSLLIFIGFRATATFYPLLLKQLDGDNSSLGISLFIMAVSEVPILFLSKKLLKNYKDTALMTVSMFFFVIKILSHILVTSIPGLIAIQATQALSFALFLPASVYYIKRISPPGLSSTYLTVAVSVYFGIGGIIGSFGGGLIVKQFGIYTMLWIGTALAVLGMLVFLFSTSLRPPHREVEENTV